MYIVGLTKDVNTSNGCLVTFLDLFAIKSGFPCSFFKSVWNLKSYSVICLHPMQREENLVPTAYGVCCSIYVQQDRQSSSHIGYRVIYRN